MPDLTKTGVIIPDVHFPIHDQAAVNCVLKAIKMVKPDIFVCLGDLGEWESVSRWRYKRRKRPPLEYQLPLINEEIEAVNNGLDQFDQALKAAKCKEKYMLQGNHDQWLDYFVEEHPYLTDLLFHKAMKLKERGYKYSKFNHPLKLGKLHFVHGAYTTTYHSKKHLESYGKNICYGHTHDVQRHTLTHMDGSIGAWSLGCLKDMSKEKNKWLNGRLHNWQHAFAVCQWYGAGDFRLEVVDIHNGKTVLWGKEIDGNNRKKKKNAKATT